MIVPDIEMQVINKTVEIPENIRKTTLGLYSAAAALELIIIIFCITVSKDLIGGYLGFLLPFIIAVGMAVYGIMDLTNKKAKANQHRLVWMLDMIIFGIAGIVGIVAGILDLVNIILPILFFVAAAGASFFAYRIYKITKFRLDS